MKKIFKIITVSSFFFLGTILNAYCIPCVCTETQSSLGNMQYLLEVDLVIAQKITPNIVESSEKTIELSRLYKDALEKTVKLKNLSEAEYVHAKKVNFLLEKIIDIEKLSNDTISIENRAIVERIKNKIMLIKTNEKIMNETLVKDMIKG